MLSPTNEAILLLNGRFAQSSQEKVEPLSPSEYSRLALWLHEKASTPKDLMGDGLAATLEGWNDTDITIDRLETLLGRGSALAFATEKWERAGVWVMSRADQDYPKRLRERLGTGAPPLLYGCGPRELLSAGGLSALGSNEASPEDETFAASFGAQVANAGFQLLSAAASRVEQSAMLGALNAGGTSVGVLADSLLKATTNRDFRQYISNASLTLLSPFGAEARFQTSNAIARNKLIYCLSDAALVVHSGTRGETLIGAKENLKQQWVPLWVRANDQEMAGNAELIETGAAKFDTEAKIESLLVAPTPQPAKKPALDLFGAAADDSRKR